MWFCRCFALVVIATLGIAAKAEGAFPENTQTQPELPLGADPAGRSSLLADEQTQKPAAPCGDTQSDQDAAQHSANGSNTGGLSDSKRDTPSNEPAAQPCQSQTQLPPARQDTTQPAPQPKRILGVMPNFRAVSAGTTPPPPSAKQRLWIATQNSFDYSAFIFVGMTSLIAEGTSAHPDLGKGVEGYGNYYWRGFLDKTDGNYWVIFALPTVFHQDERYYAMGKGGFWKRGFYSATRIFVTPDNHGHPSFNASELLGRGIAQGISTAYYPPSDRTLGALASKYAYALGRDALTNVFREFWPDIATHVLHRHP